MQQLPLVFLDKPARLSMGLSALDPDDWLWIDDRFAVETAERARLIAERPLEVLGLLPEAVPAALELADAARRFMAAKGIEVPDRGEPLARLGAAAQEDFCLMQALPDGRYALTGAVLCFPAHWRLREKLGRPLAEIHAPVPGFADRLAGPVNRLFGSLSVERPVWRANWSIVESPALFHPGARTPDPELTADNAGDRLWLRVERQTLRRLPETRAIVFTIRTLIEPLACTVRRPGAAQAMAERFAEMDAATAAYKGLPPMREPLLAYLQRCVLAEQAEAAVAEDEAASGQLRSA